MPISHHSEMKFQIEQMLPTDQGAVLEIYRLGLESGLATFETEVPAWEQWDAAHYTRCRFVARRGPQVIGWVALSPVSKRSVYAGLAEVSIYIHPEYQRQGVGNALMLELIRCSRDAGFWTLQASIFPQNQASQALLLKCGFRVVGRREKIAQLHGIWRDTLLLERRIPDTDPEDA